MDLVSGAILARRYRIERPLGAGAMGEVWEATHLAIGTKVAVKRLSGSGAASHELVARFKREAQMLGRIRSDYVARLLDFVEDPTYGFLLVMELVEGRSLIQILGERRLSVRETVELGCDILRALSDLHAAHVIHRDLKPGNLIVRPERRSAPRAILVDFGMSRVQHQGSDDELTSITRADTALGTLSYMAPEQMLSSRDVTGSADLYAAGAILFRALAGHHAYIDDDESALARKKLTEEAPRLPTTTDPVSEGLADIVARALRRKPAQRFANADEMLFALERLRTGTSMFHEDTTTHDGSVPSVVAAPVAAVATPAVMPSGAYPSASGAHPSASGAYAAAAVPQATPSGAVPLPPETSSDPVSLHALEQGSSSRSMSRVVAPPPSSRATRAGIWIAIASAVVALVGAVILMRPVSEGPAASSAPTPAATREPSTARPVASPATTPAPAPAPAPTPAPTPVPTTRDIASLESAPSASASSSAARAAAAAPRVPRVVAAPSAAPAAPAPPAANTSTDGF